MLHPPWILTNYLFLLIKSFRVVPASPRYFPVAGQMPVEIAGLIVEAKGLLRRAQNSFARRFLLRILRFSTDNSRAF